MHSNGLLFSGVIQPPAPNGTPFYPNRRQEVPTVVVFSSPW